MHDTVLRYSITAWCIISSYVRFYQLFGCCPIICVIVWLDKDDIKRLYHPWLSRQVDADCQVHWDDVVCVGRSQSWQRRSICSHCQLLWQHSLSSLSEVWQEWGKEKRGQSEFNIPFIWFFLLLKPQPNVSSVILMTRSILRGNEYENMF